jgi:CRISPR-associated endonuclease Cas1
VCASIPVAFDVRTESHEEIIPRHGVVTLFGYGTSVCVDRGHLVLEDGIGPHRRQARFPRVGHRLKRLVVVGSDGIVSLAALRWLADQDAAFVMLDRDGSVLATTGPVRSSDARLRRAQAFAEESGAAIQITKELIAQKLLGQERVAREGLHDSQVAERIAGFRGTVDLAKTVLAIRQSEALAAKAYWNGWRDITINFPRADLRRVPEHWKHFGTRESPLTNSPRLAVNPPNAILNYLYAMLESEARLGAAALGLDAGLGVLHLDTRTRDSLACDLMEPVRPKVDAHLLDWISKGPLRRDWFFEQRDGNCRLMGAFAQQLSETALTWRNAVAPYAERCARVLWSTVPTLSTKRFQSTPLTQSHRRIAKGGRADISDKPAPRPPAICRLCGKAVRPGTTCCASCSTTISREELINAAHKGRIASQTPKVLARLGEKQRSHRLAERAWKPEDKPDWLNQEAYEGKIHPRLADVTISTIALTLGVSLPYASDIRAGRRRPHPRHWLVLARLVDVLSGG